MQRTIVDNWVTPTDPLAIAHGFACGHPAPAAAADAWAAVATAHWKRTCTLTGDKSCKTSLPLLSLLPLAVCQVHSNREVTTIVATTEHNGL